MDENHHYDLAIRRQGHGYAVIERLNIGDVKSVVKVVERHRENHASLLIRADHEYYRFYLMEDGGEVFLGSAQTKYLSSEVAGGFAGVVIGLYAQDADAEGIAEFSNYMCNYLQ